jgi:hypothetical protein
MLRDLFIAIVLSLPAGSCLKAARRSLDAVVEVPLPFKESNP